MTAIRRCDTPLGPCLLAGDEAALTGLWFVGAKHFARTLPEDAREYRLSVLDDAEAWLRAYFAGERPAPDAQREEATLEDVFFHEFGEKAGGEDGAL